jgi:hypothetical protein
VGCDSCSLKELHLLRKTFFFFFAVCVSAMSAAFVAPFTACVTDRFSFSQHSWCKN